MKNGFLILFLALTGLLLSTGATYAELVIIGNQDLKIDSLTKKQLKQVFLGRTSTVGMEKIELVDCSALQDQFLSKYLGKSLKSYNKIWIKKIFAEGATPPVNLKDVNEVIDYVRSTKNAIGYVDSAPADVKVLLK
ncbi:MAG: phosphate ABC transporter substrate-binding protein [Nitrospinota bacterium]